MKDRAMVQKWDGVLPTNGVHGLHEVQPQLMINLCCVTARIQDKKTEPGA
jgi:hypothetical protein